MAEQGPEAPRNGTLPVHYLGNWEKSGGMGGNGEGWEFFLAFLVEKWEILCQNPQNCTFCWWTSGEGREGRSKWEEMGFLCHLQEYGILLPYKPHNYSQPPPPILLVAHILNK